jgi:hypothetical protein
MTSTALHGGHVGVAGSTIRADMAIAMGRTVPQAADE